MTQMKKKSTHLILHYLNDIVKSFGVTGASKNILKLLLQLLGLSKRPRNLENEINTQ
jgi:hypothetical protein